MTPRQLWQFHLWQSKLSWWHVKCVKGLSVLDWVFYPRWAREFRDFERQFEDGEDGQG